ncbi:hypothetical protein FACS1894219_08720 [Clostridia bacterium]|nr:hypothetical protein FACS1894219_08720 [Clostridia bacterium]
MNYVNNHIHTCYSFSPYTPTEAAAKAKENGLVTAGIMDHDSLAGAREFIEAGKKIGIATTVGVEMRVDVRHTKLNGKRINNPDQKSVAYVALHGIPHQYIELVDGFLAPFRIARGMRNAQMCAKINAITSPFGITLDYERDVVTESRSGEGGSVTERHITYALAKKIAEKYDTPAKVIAFLRDEMKIAVSPKAEKSLNENNPAFYLYDILGILKAELVEKFYVDAYDECPSVDDYLRIARITGAISAYAYLGDVGDSVTGDKKTQKFEDDYLDLLFEELSSLGFRAVTYMPTRNTKEQLARVISLCEKYNLFQISGEDINSPRQGFICKALEDPAFAHLIDSTWALINHERRASEDERLGMFAEDAIKKYPVIADRVKYFASCK